MFWDKIVKKKASMKDEPNIPKIQAQENDFMQSYSNDMMCS